MNDFSPSQATILLLDSDGSTRSVLREALENAGYLVQSAEDIGVAVDRLSELQPDLLLTRPYINGMTGRFAAHYLRTRSNGLPVLIVAGFMDDDRLTYPNEVDDIQSFPEPFARDAFLAKVHDVIAAVKKRKSSQ